MTHFHTDPTAKALNRLHRPSPKPLTDDLVARARNCLHGETAPARVIEVGEVTAGIAVPEPGSVRFFSSERDFDVLDGAVFRSVEQAAKAVRDRFRHVARTPSRGRPSLRPSAGAAQFQAV